MNITGDTLRKVVLNITAEKATEIALISNELCPVYGIDSASEYHEFIANVAHESGGFRIRKESLNYTRPERLVQVWPSRFSLTGEVEKKNARDFVGKPDALANFVYGGRMGNVQRGDGAAFVGGGFAQITGRDAYTMFTRFVNSRDLTRRSIQEVAILVQTNDKWAFDSALWFFCVFKNLEELAAQDNFKEVVRRWNGGFIGMEDRKLYYQRAQQYII